MTLVNIQKKVRMHLMICVCIMCDMRVFHPCELYLIPAACNLCSLLFVISSGVPVYTQGCKREEPQRARPPSCWKLRGPEPSPLSLLKFHANLGADIPIFLQIA
jgi:hypothetical protein